MRTERGYAIALAMLAALGGCATTSYSSDLRRVQELSRLAIPMRVADNPPEDHDPAVVEAVLARPLTAEAAVGLALRNNRRLRASLRDLGVARGWLAQAGALPNPALEFDVRYQTDRAQPLQGDIRLEFGLTRAILTGQRVGVARAELQSAQARVAGAVLDLGFEVRAAFYAVQSSEERLVAAQQALDAFAAARDLARSLHEAGNIRALDLSMQEAAYETARVTVAEIELERLDRRERVQRLLGLHGEATGWSVEGGLPVTPEALALDAMTETRALQASLDLAAQRANLEVLARRVGLSQREGWLPDITVDAHAEQDGNTIEVGGGARVVLPLLDQRRGATAAYGAQFDAALERYYASAVDLRSAFRDARNRVRSAHARARQYDAVIVPARERVLRETLLQYNAMQVSVFQLLQARRELLDATLRRAEVRREFWTATTGTDALLAGRPVGTTAPLSVDSPMSASNPTAGGH
ncbi:MAG: TolC family protein [Deltaproteobacteria bacterium]|nr:TolC family protein [Deltaproteobacteria bacterium]